MSDKAECPGCHAYSSTIYSVIWRGDPDRCPYCGLGRQAIIDINQVQRSQATKALKARHEELLKRLDKAEQASVGIPEFVDTIREALDRFDGKAV